MLAIISWLLITIVLQTILTSFVIHGAFVEKHGTISDQYFTEYLTFRRQVSSLSSCAMYCYHDLECVSYFFNYEEQWCQAHSVLFSKVMPSKVTDPGTRYYSIHEDWCSMPGYLNHRGLELCYKLYSQKGSYQNSVDFCIGKGEELITHLNINQLVQVTHHINTTNFQFVYIDGTDEGTEGTWYFINGDPITDFMWGPGEPENDYIEDHNIALMKFPDGSIAMTDARPVNNRPFLCNKGHH